MDLRRGLLAAAFAGLVLAAMPNKAAAASMTSPSTPASGHKCGGFLLGPDAVDLIENLRAQSVSCSLARAVAKGSREPGASFDARLRYSSHGFSCHGRFVSPPNHGEGHIHFRCTRGRQVVTFIHN
jgi:hypothetical protein